MATRSGLYCASADFVYIDGILVPLDVQLSPRRPANDPVLHEHTERIRRFVHDTIPLFLTTEQSDVSTEGSTVMIMNQVGGEGQDGSGTDSGDDVWTVGLVKRPPDADIVSRAYHHPAYRMRVLEMIRDAIKLGPEDCIHSSVQKFLHEVTSSPSLLPCTYQDVAEVMLGGQTMPLVGELLLSIDGPGSPISMKSTHTLQSIVKYYVKDTAMLLELTARSAAAAVHVKHGGNIFQIAVFRLLDAWFDTFMKPKLLRPRVLSGTMDISALCSLLVTTWRANCNDITHTLVVQMLSSIGEQLAARTIANFLRGRARSLLISAGSSLGRRQAGTQLTTLLGKLATSEEVIRRILLEGGRMTCKAVHATEPDHIRVCAAQLRDTPTRIPSFVPTLIEHLASIVRSPRVSPERTLLIVKTLSSSPHPCVTGTGAATHWRALVSPRRAVSTVAAHARMLGQLRCDASTFTQLLRDDDPKRSEKRAAHLQKFPQHVVASLVQALLLEQTVIVVSSRTTLLSRVVDALLDMVAPFVWTHTIQSVAAPSFFKHLRSALPDLPLPMLLGVHTSLLSPNDLRRWSRGDACIVDLDNMCVVAHGSGPHLSDGDAAKLQQHLTPVAYLLPSWMKVLQVEELYTRFDGDLTVSRMESHLASIPDLPPFLASFARTEAFTSLAIREYASAHATRLAADGEYVRLVTLMARHGTVNLLNESVIHAVVQGGQGRVPTPHRMKMLEALLPLAPASSLTSRDEQGRTPVMRAAMKVQTEDLCLMLLDVESDDSIASLHDNLGQDLATLAAFSCSLRVLSRVAPIVDVNRPIKSRGYRTLVATCVKMYLVRQLEVLLAVADVDLARAFVDSTDVESCVSTLARRPRARITTLLCVYEADLDGSSVRLTSGLFRQKVVLIQSCVRRFLTQRTCVTSYPGLSVAGAIARGTKIRMLLVAEQRMAHRTQELLDCVASMANQDEPSPELHALESFVGHAHIAERLRRLANATFQCLSALRSQVNDRPYAPAFQTKFGVYLALVGGRLDTLLDGCGATMSALVSLPVAETLDVSRKLSTTLFAVRANLDQLVHVQEATPAGHHDFENLRVMIPELEAAASHMLDQLALPLTSLIVQCELRDCILGAQASVSWRRLVGAAQDRRDAHAAISTIVSPLRRLILHTEVRCDLISNASLFMFSDVLCLVQQMAGGRSVVEKVVWITPQASATSVSQSRTKLSILDRSGCSIQCDFPSADSCDAVRKHVVSTVDRFNLVTDTMRGVETLPRPECDVVTISSQFCHLYVDSTTSPVDAVSFVRNGAEILTLRQESLPALVHIPWPGDLTVNTMRKRRTIRRRRSSPGVEAGIDRLVLLSGDMRHAKVDGELVSLSDDARIIPRNPQAEHPHVSYAETSSSSLSIGRTVSNMDLFSAGAAVESQLYYAASRSAALLDLICSAQIPPNLRPRMWRRLADTFRAGGALPNLDLAELWTSFERCEMDHRQRGILGQIEKDVVQRKAITFAASLPNPAKFGSQVQRLLQAAWFVDQEVGYTQGMDKIMAFLLLKNSEESSFHMYQCIMQKYNLRALYEDGFSLLMKWLRELEACATDEQPQFVTMISQEGRSITELAVPWFLCLFTTANLTEIEVQCMWDFILFSGLKDGMFRLSISFMSELCDMVDDEVCSSVSDAIDSPRISHMGTFLTRARNVNANQWVDGGGGA